MFKKGVFTVICITFLQSCDTNDIADSTFEKYESNFDEKITLVQNSSYTLYLDSTTTPESTNLQYIIEGNNETLAYWNRVDASIVYFDLRDGIITRKQAIPRTGPNANGTSNFFILTPDSIFTTDYSNLKFINSQSEISAVFPTSNPGEFKHTPDPYIWNCSPMFYSQGHVYFQVYIGGVFGQNNMARVDLASSKLEYFSEYPEFYQKAYWRGGFEFMDLTFNEKERMVIQSYSADHYLRSIKLDSLGKIDKHFAGVSAFGTITPPRMSMTEPGREKDEKKFKLQPSFGPVFYDQYNEVYYRFAYDPMPEHEFESNDPKLSKIKPVRIITLDKTLTKVGETRIDRFKYDLNMTFVSKKGLCLKRVNEANEDIVQFDVFAPKSIR